MIIKYSLGLSEGKSIQHSIVKIVITKKITTMYKYTSKYICCGDLFLIDKL